MADQPLSTPATEVIQQYLENAGVPSDDAALLARIKGRYLAGEEITEQEEKVGLDIVEKYKEKVTSAKENLHESGYTIEKK